MLLILFSTHSLSGQTHYSLLTELRTQFSTQDELPFWMYNNQRGRVSNETNLLGLLSGKVIHSLDSQAVIEAGAGVVVRNGLEKELALDELYVQYRNRHFYATAGARQRKKLYRGLSATNENILWSLNARPLPGVEIGTTEPVFLFPGIGFKARWGEYILEKDRHVPRARVHHKKFNLVLRPAKDWQITAGIQHFAQWGGISPDKGPQPNAFRDYIRIVSGRQGGENAIKGEINNSLGNHLGSYEVEVKRKLNSHNFSLIYNSIFEDGTGSRLANFPDGRYGLFWKKNSSAGLISGVLYEFYYTKNQSYGVNKFGADNYFNHLLVYNSGWTHFKQPIGAPFFLYDKQENRFISNKFLAHHIGAMGNLGSAYNPYPYRLMLSYSHHEGTYRDDVIPADREPKTISTYFITRLYNENSKTSLSRLTLDLFFAADYSNHWKPNFGTGLSLIYVIK